MVLQAVMVAASALNAVGDLASDPQPEMLHPQPPTGANAVRNTHAENLDKIISTSACRLWRCFAAVNILQESQWPCADTAGSAAVGGRIGVLFAGDGRQHAGWVLAYSAKSGKHHILYEDGEVSLKPVPP